MKFLISHVYGLITLLPSYKNCKSNVQLNNLVAQHKCKRANAASQKKSQCQMSCHLISKIDKKVYRF